MQLHVHLATATATDVSVSMSLRPVNDCHLMQSTQMQLVFDTQAETQIPQWPLKFMQKSTQLHSMQRV